MYKIVFDVCLLYRMTIKYRNCRNLIFISPTLAEKNVFFVTILIILFWDSGIGKKVKIWSDTFKKPCKTHNSSKSLV